MWNHFDEDLLAMIMICSWTISVINTAETSNVETAQSCQGQSRDTCHYMYKGFIITALYPLNHTSSLIWYRSSWLEE